MGMIPSSFIAFSSEMAMWVNVPPSIEARALSTRAKTNLLGKSMVLAVGLTSFSCSAAAPLAMTRTSHLSVSPP